MGTQGEIYNILGVKLRAGTVIKDELYQINGRTVAGNETLYVDADFINGIPNTTRHNLDNPTLVVRLLGYDFDIKSHNFEGEALVGYVLANESYANNATALPSSTTIDELRPKLVADLHDQLDYDANASDLEIFLMFDFAQ